jgi:hypothetical protein
MALRGTQAPSEPRQCHIVVVRTTTMSHRRGRDSGEHEHLGLPAPVIETRRWFRPPDGRLAALAFSAPD